MWSCQACRVRFVTESREQHLYHNHLKPLVGGVPVKVYHCDVCRYSAECFEDMADHCIRLRHRPTRVNKGMDYDEYASQLFMVLEEIMTANEPFDGDNVREDKQQQQQQPTAESTANNDKQQEKPGTMMIDWLKDEDINKISAAVADMDAENRQRKAAGKTGLSLSTQPPEPAAANETVGVQEESQAVMAATNSNSNDAQNQDSLASGPRHECSVCHRVLTTKTAKRNHERIHRDERPFHCPLCPKRCRTNGDLIKHSRVHSGDKPYKCAYCSKVFSQHSNWKAHEKQTHSEARKRRYECVEVGCDEAFETRPYWRCHVEICPKRMERLNGGQKFGHDETISARNADSEKTNGGKLNDQSNGDAEQPSAVLMDEDNSERRID